MRRLGLIINDLGRFVGAVALAIGTCAPGFAAETPGFFSQNSQKLFSSGLSEGRGANQAYFTGSLPENSAACAADSNAASEFSPIPADNFGTDTFSFSAKAESGPSRQTRGYLTGNGFEFTAEDAQAPETIMRGSVNLPELKSLQVWGNAYYGGGHVNPNGWDGRINESAAGATIGLNIPFGALATALYYNPHRNKTKYCSGFTKQKTNLVGGSAYLHAGGFYFAVLGAYGKDKYGSTGYYQATDEESGESYGATRYADFNGWQATGYAETGYEWPTLGLFVLKPFGSYQYSYLEHANFDPTSFEGGDGKRNYDSFYMTLGSRVDVNLAGLDTFTLQGRMAWVTQMRSSNESLQNFCFGRIPGTLAPSQPYFVGQGAGRDFFWGGVGLRLSLMNMFSLSLDYDCLVNKYQTFQLGSVGVLFGF
ncbi:MAG: autotransporter outer membrane beta-barrel domain-containing protein [Thermoguttaceae bacterium]|nr:autotransporter outer membrane beta-barrel domain-containing protein [Thermoguttaceae bacterium]